MTALIDADLVERCARAAYAANPDIRGESSAEAEAEK